uniref:Nucleoside phosphorylase domain-containing protein n=1 Tax=Equus asinus TaxID=9793 RepID=A0A9L0K6R7_EQUAS
MPSEVNYRANIWALKEEGCTHVIVTTACGSLREEIRPGDIVIIDQFIDSCFVQMRVQRRSTHYTLTGFLTSLALGPGLHVLCYSQTRS